MWTIVRNILSVTVFPSSKQEENFTSSNILPMAKQRDVMDRHWQAVTTFRKRSFRERRGKNLDLLINDQSSKRKQENMLPLAQLPWRRSQDFLVSIEVLFTIAWSSQDFFFCKHKAKILATRAAAVTLNCLIHLTHKQYCTVILSCLGRNGEPRWHSG